MATVATVRYQRGRGSELLLLGLSALIAVSARALVDYHAAVLVISQMVWYTVIVIAVLLAIHFALRRWARDADPVIIPAVAALTGVGLAMIRRIDFAWADRGAPTHFAQIQSMWVLVGAGLCIVIIVVLRDYRVLRRFTYTAGVLGLVGLLLPLLPVIGREVNGARIWIGLFGRSLQPGEFAKIAFVIFFAGYLQTNRDTLAVTGPKILGIRFPRARDMGPLIVVWAAAIAVQVFEQDLGTSLLLFGIFVGMLYVATRRTSWVVLGMGMFLVGAAFAGTLFPHVRVRYVAWLHALDPSVYSSGQSQQLVRGLFGMASGGLFGTGLGQGRPDLVPYAYSDFIVASLGEELGLTGLLAILMLYVIIVHRAMRTAIGVARWLRQVARRRAGLHHRAADLHRGRRRDARDPAYGSRDPVPCVRWLRDDRQLDHRRVALTYLRSGPKTTGGDGMNEPVRKLSVVVLVMFLALMIAASWIQVVTAGSLNSDSRNVRTLYREFGNFRGPFVVDGDRVVYSKPVDDSFNYQRTYTNGELYASATGYYSIVYGKTGLEQTENSLLAGTSDALFWNRLRDLFGGREQQGASIELTLRAELQKTAMKELGNQKGAVVAIDPRTGEILAMVTSPTFDPALLAGHDTEEVNDAYAELDADPDGPLVNRAIAGDTYPPGSTFKLIVSAAALDAGYTPDSTVYAPDELPLPGSTATIKNYGGESCGKTEQITLEQALTVSCNTALCGPRDHPRMERD